METPGPSEHTNGGVLGYKVFFSDVNSISRGIKSVHSPAETSVKIESLRPNRNCSFQVLAFKAKGDGEISAQYFVKTRAGKMKMAKTFFNRIKRFLFYTLGVRRDSCLANWFYNQIFVMFSQALPVNITDLLTETERETI